MEILNCLHVCSRSVKTGQQRVRSVIVAATQDQVLCCNPVLHAAVIMSKLDSSFSQGAPGYSRETPSASWEACLSRLPGEDSLTLSHRILEAFFQKIGDEDMDPRKVWANELWATEVNRRTALCLGNDISDPARGKANHYQFTLRWGEAQQRHRSGSGQLQEISNTYIAAHYIVTFELANAASKALGANLGGPAPTSASKRVAAVQAQAPAKDKDADSLLKMVAALSKQVSDLKVSNKRDNSSPVAAAFPVTSAPQGGRGGKGDRGGGRGGRGQPWNPIPTTPLNDDDLPPANQAEMRTYSQGRRCAPPQGDKGNPSKVPWTKDNWEYGTFIDFDEFTRLAPFAKLCKLISMARPNDNTLTTPRKGRPHSDNGTWTNEIGCAYCLHRPRAPPGTAEEDKWFYGTGQGAHSPYRCQCFVRFLAEGGGTDVPPDLGLYLQGILLKRGDKPQ